MKAQGRKARLSIVMGFESRSNAEQMVRDLQTGLQQFGLVFQVHVASPWESAR